MKIEEIAKKYALKNCYDYGEANPKFVVPKVIGELKEKSLPFSPKEVVEIVRGVVEEVNTIAKEQGKEKIGELLSSYEFRKRKEKEKILEFENAITRFAPEPSGYLHIGHAKAAFLSYEIAKQNNGKFLLRFDDTNPKNEKEEFVKAIREDLEWLEIRWDKEYFTSDFMEFFYERARYLIEKGFMYVSTSPLEKIRESRAKSIPLPERSSPPEKNLELFDKMLEGYFEEGEAVVLWKGELSSENTALRDPTMFRVITTPHYRQSTKYLVWPSYDFVTPILDSLHVTLAMRSKEYELREKLYYDILEKLGMKKPKLIHFSRLKVKGAVVSKRLLKPLVESSKVSGWDDPRLLTIRGLRRRGIHKLAIKNFALRFGIGKQEKVVDLSFLLKENRKVLDPIAKRIMFIRNPVKVEIDFNGEVTLPFHPSSHLGNKTLRVKGFVFIEKEDLNLGKVNLKGIGCFDLSSGKRCRESSSSLKTIPWVSSLNEATLFIVEELLNEKGELNPLKQEKGFVEESIKEIREGEIVHLERIGFARLDNKKEKIFILSS